MDKNIEEQAIHELLEKLRDWSNRGDSYAWNIERFALRIRDYLEQPDTKGYYKDMANRLGKLECIKMYVHNEIEYLINHSNKRDCTWFTDIKNHLPDYGF